MLKEEFEELVGRKVTDAEYVNADAVYMELYDDKRMFCRDWEDLEKVRGLLCDVLSEMQRLRKDLKDCKAQMEEAGMRLLAAQNDIQVNTVSEIDVVVPLLLGEKCYLRTKVEEGWHLTDDDREMLCRILKED